MLCSTKVAYMSQDRKKNLRKKVSLTDGIVERGVRGQSKLGSKQSRNN